MKDTNTMFSRAWITAGHSDLWNCRGTYCKVPYENLPALPRATDDLEWLDHVSTGLRAVINRTSTLDSSDNKIARLEEVVAKTQHLGLALPQPFLCFMQDTDLQGKVPTCTACFLSLSEELIPLSGTEETFLLRFLNDSQSCFMWYLSLSRGGCAGVLVSDYFLESELFDAMEYEGVRREDVLREAFLCADTFTEFLYRFWIENTIWYSLRERLPFTSLQEDYRHQISKRL